METIHVVVCGLETDEVQSALEGVVTQSHYAWKKSYAFACTIGPAVDFVHEDVFNKLCSVIVLCNGCTPPPSLDYYYNIATVAMPDCPEECLAGIREAEFFYGVIPCSDLRAKVLSLALAPLHIIYDALLGYFTPVGELAARRAFWILDKDCDGLLQTEDMVHWRRQVQKRDFERNHVQSFFDSQIVSVVEDSRLTEEEKQGYSAEQGLSCSQFTSYMLALLGKGETIEVWATLHAVGTHPNGLPYSWSDVNSAQNPFHLGNSYLSPYGITFFKNVYRRIMPRASSDIWGLTPGCPWSAISGIPSEKLSLDQFIEAWKYMALEQPDTVIIYARFWGYKGGPMQLFVRQNARASRKVSDPVPNCVQVLIVGAAGTGRRSLATALVGESPPPKGFASHPSSAENALFVRTTTRCISLLSGQQAMEPLTYVFTVVSAGMTNSILGNEVLNHTIDVVIFCFDHSQPTKSISLISAMLRHVKAMGSCKKMPFIIVGTKSDLLDPTSPQLPCTEEITCFGEQCRRDRLLWPPMLMSAHASPADNTAEVTIMAEYIYHAVRDPDIAIGCAPANLLRSVGRIGLLTTAFAGTSMVLRRVGAMMIRYLCRRRRQHCYDFTPTKNKNKNT
eukprot:gene10167-7121_t